MAYIVKAPGGIRLLATGKKWRYGGQIGEHQLPPNVRDALLAEGAIVESRPAPKPEAVDPLMGIEGVTWELAGHLHAMGFNTVAAVAEADPDVLIAIPRVGKSTASRLISSAEKLMNSEQEQVTEE